MAGENLVAHGESIPRDNQHKQAPWLEPPIGVLKKHLLHPAILSITTLIIVRWIQVEQRE
jgi:hypothetical protein